MSIHKLRINYLHHLAALKASMVSIAIVFAVMFATFYAIQWAVDYPVKLELYALRAEQAEAQRAELEQILSGTLAMKDVDAGTYKFAKVVWQDALAQKELLK